MDDSPVVWPELDVYNKKRYDLHPTVAAYRVMIASIVVVVVTLLSQVDDPAQTRISIRFVRGW